MGLGATLCAAVVSAGLIVLRTVQSGSPSGSDLQFMMLAGATLLGVATAIASATTAIGDALDLWRRSVTGALAAFGGLLLAGVLSTIADMLAGRIGLAILLLIFGLAARHLFMMVRAARGF